MTSEGTTDARADVIELLTADHRRMDEAFRQLQLAAGTDAVENQRHLAQHLVKLLSVHAAVEEQVVYPALRTALPDGNEIVDASLAEHAELKRLLADLDGRRPGDEALLAGFTAVMEIVSHHAAEEEVRLFPALRQAVDSERLVELGEAVMRARKLAPTRPHPHVPDRPPANVVAGAVVALADRARDVVRDLRGSQP